MGWLLLDSCPTCTGSNPNRLLLQAATRRYPVALREAVLCNDAESVKRLVAETAAALGGEPR